jgi:hypothetical protein
MHEIEFRLGLKRDFKACPKAISLAGEKSDGWKIIKFRLRRFSTEDVNETIEST